MWRAGVAVRRDWPGTGHDFVRLCDTVDEVDRFIKGDRKFWCRGPVQPVYSTVAMSLRDFNLHRRRGICRAPDCPMSTPEHADHTAVVA